MNALARSWRPPAILLAVAIAAAPLPAMAGEPSSTAAKPGPGIRTSVEKAVTTQTLATARPAWTGQQSGTTTDLESKSFFKTPGGIAALLAIGVGVGLALYSTSNDRIKSPAR